MQFLKADTQVIVSIGPFVDVGDGFTPQTDITLAGNEAELIKHGSTSVVDISGRTWAAVTSCRGWYSLTLTAADTDTEGQLVVIVQDDSDCLPVWKEFTVVNANVYDSLFAAAATDYLQVDVEQVDGDATAAANLNSACDNYSATRGLSGTALPAAVADAAGGLPISDAGGLDLDLYLKSGVTLTGTANVADTTVKITLTGGVATDNYYNGQLVVITGGTGVGQARTILKYLASGTAATPTRDFAVAPDNTSTFVVIGADVPSILEAGVATAATASNITLDATAPTTVDIFKNNFIMISGGTGAGQTRLIGAYSAGRVATILPNWTTTPDTTSIYQVLPMARVDIQGWLGNVVTGDGDWAALKAETALIVADTNELQADDYPTSIAAIQTTADAIETDTQDLQTQVGTAGAGLTDLGGMSTTMKAQVNTEADGAIETYKLDHLVAAADADDPVNDSIIAKLASTTGDWSTFSDTTDSLESIRNYTAKGIPKNVAKTNIPVLMVDSTDHVTPKTGLTLTEEVSKDAVGFAACTGSSAEIGNGWYQFDASQADMNGDILVFKFTATGADATQITFFTSTPSA